MTLTLPPEQADREEAEAAFEEQHARDMARHQAFFDRLHRHDRRKRQFVDREPVMVFEI